MQLGVTAAITKLSAYMTYISTARVLHGATFLMVCIELACSTMVLLCLIMYFLHYAAPSRAKRGLALILIGDLFLAFVFWYPGYFAVRKGMAPWPFPGSQVKSGLLMVLRFVRMLS